MENTDMKKSLGRQKIEIKKIEKKNNLQVTFSKRRKGLTKKAAELSVLCGNDVAVFVQSPAGKLHTFCNIPVESIIDRFLNMNIYSSDDLASRFQVVEDSNEKKCLEIMKKLEVEKEVEKILGLENKGNYGTKGHWWDQPFDHLHFNELQLFKEKMEALKNNVMKKTDEKAKGNYNDILIPNVTVDCFGGLPVPHFESTTSSFTSLPLMLFNPNPNPNTLSICTPHFEKISR